MPLTQDHRNLAINTPLGKDVLLLQAFSYTEQLGRMFQLEAELLSEKTDIDFDQIVGKNVTIRLETPQKKTRYFNGFVSRFLQVPAAGRLAQYRATIVPWLWFLTRGADCRIFQKKTVPEIIKQVFRDEGFTDFRESLTGKHEAWEYCVQYRETNFNFVSRLMEQEGIYYFFDHVDGKHTLVLADAVSAHKPAAGYAKLPFRGVETGVREKEYISQWVLEQEIQPGVYALNDFDFQKPRNSLHAKSEEPRAHEQSKYEVYDYPGEYDRQSDGTTYSRIRIEELQTQYLVARGQSTACGLSAGATFTLQYFPRADRNKAYLITSVSLHATGDDFEGNSTGGGGDFLACNFTAIDAKQQFRPARITPKPLIQGVQTAIVVGPKGEEIHVDDFARVKVQFHWDRYGKMDENSSCWIRTSHPWAGKGYGGMAVPRIGQEVIVEFLEGDPDQPIINGRVYNAEQNRHGSNAGRKTPGPTDFKQAAMMTSLKSQSLGGGGGHNEITMNDTGGAEGLFFKAQKDEIHNVGNDREDTVGNNETRSVKVDRKREVGNNESVKIGNNEIVTIGANAHETVGVAKAVHVGTDLLITAGTSITLQCGAGIIHMNQAGVISITGTIILVGGAITTDITAPITTISGLALLQTGVISVNAGVFTKVTGSVTTSIDGGVVKIN